MGKRVAFTDQAKADLRAIDQQTALQILKTLARFVQSEEGNVKRLQGVEPPLYRFRTQDHASSSATSAIVSKSRASAIGERPTVKGWSGAPAPRPCTPCAAYPPRNAVWRPSALEGVGARRRG
jgi:hypothetical protein